MQAKALGVLPAHPKAGFEPITLHEARHTFASLMIAAGVSAMASITITFDRYGHLIPGNEGEAAELLDVYLAGREGGSVSRAPR